MMIDTHLHIWNTDEVGIRWLSDAGLPAQATIPDDFHDAADGVSRRYVLVEADADESSRETEWLISAARSDARVHGVVACALLERGEDVRADIERMTAAPEIVGVRRLLQDRKHFDSPAFVDGLRILAEHELPFDACVRAHELPQLIDVLDQVPDLVVVLDHMGKPPVNNPSAMPSWRRDLSSLSTNRRVYCKLSGLPAECRDHTHLDEVATGVIADAVEAFGPDRCLLGSDRPISVDRADWCSRVIDLIPPAHRATVAYQNAIEIYQSARVQGGIEQ